MRNAIVIILLGIAVSAAPDGIPGKDLVSQARLAAADYATALQSALLNAMKEGGPSGAIGVCHTRAFQITEEIGEVRGLIVSRTTLKPRNPMNEPDPWARRVLERFQTQMDRGGDPAKMEFSEIVQGEDARVFRYMKPIVVRDICLACHGAAMDPKVAGAISKIYPKDAAVGYKAGDLRGAFSVSRILTGPQEP
jgi:hypothetical protein